MCDRVMSRHKDIFLILGLVIILVACGGNQNPTLIATQPISPTQASEQGVQLANTQSPVETQATVVTQPPGNTQAATSTPAQPGYSLTSVCPLVTKDEVETNLGTSVEDPVEQNFPPIFSCRYEDSEGINIVDLTVTEFTDAAQAEEVFQMAIDLNNYQQVSGIGDRAYQSEVYDITAQKGKYELSISVVNSEDKEIRREKAKVLALSALGRLP